MNYTLSSSITDHVELRSLTLYYPIYESTGEEGMFMLGTLCCDSHPLHETPASCQFTRSNRDFFTVTGKMLFPILYRDCPVNTNIVLTLLDKNMNPFAITSIALFDENRVLRQGYQKVEFYSAVGETVSTVPLDCGYKEIDDYLKWNDMKETIVDAQCHWLEDITEDRCNEVTEASILKKIRYLEALGRKLYNHKFTLPIIPHHGSSGEQDAQANEICLEMVFQLANYGNVHFGDITYTYSSIQDDHLALINASVLDIRELHDEPTNCVKWDDFSPIYNDFEIGLPNPVDKKVNSLKKSVGRRFYSAEEKPTNEEKTALLRLVNSPILFENMTEEEKTLLWTFRHVLYGVKYSLPKILAVMDLDDPVEMKNAMGMLTQYPSLCIEDILQLLGKEMKYEAIRAFAVDQLNHTVNDEDLELYLLQLVQALRYENQLLVKEEKEVIVKRKITMVREKTEEEEPTETGAEPAAEQPVEAPKEEETNANETLPSVDETPATEQIDDVIEEEVEEVQMVPVIKPVSPLLCLLIERCSNKRSLASLFLHYVRVEGNGNAPNPKDRNEDFIQVESAFLDYLMNTDSCKQVYEELVKEEKVTSELFKLSDRIIEMGGRAQKKQENLRSLLSTEFRDTFADHPLLPIRPDLPLEYVLPSTAKVFQSAMTPFCLEFVIENSERKAIQVKNLRRDSFSISTISEGDNAEVCKGCGATFSKCTCLNCIECKSVMMTNKHHCRKCRYAVCTKCSEKNEQDVLVCASHDQCARRSHLVLQVMVKNGDDVRQDQMVIQIIRIMNKLLNDMNLDLCLSPYSVLAISPSKGMLEMVQNSKALSGVKSIRAFLKENHPDSSSELGIDPVVMDTYVRSCAGYAVITYLLGIGDRHLDNIMIDKDGHLYHIDFGYIFGKDPKVKEALMRITNDMIDGMGGQNSRNYQLFLGYAFQAFHILRQNAILLITLLRLMLDANIKDCKPDLLDKMIQRFCLGMSDEEAERNFREVLEKCIGDLFVGMLEIAHNIATSMR